MEVSHYMFAGVGVAISVLAFFLKKNKAEIDGMKSLLHKLEISDARNSERINTLNKVVEDRRRDIQNLYEKTQK
jgi:hypothetical protein